MTNLDKLMAVMDEAFDPHWREAWTRRQVDDSLALSSGFMMLVDQDGREPAPENGAAGFILARKVLDEIELLLIGVLPEMRGRGLGRILLDSFTEYCRSVGAAQIFLEMRANNPAESFYRSAGFAPIGSRSNYYRALDGTHIDAVTFVKIL